MTSNTGSTAEPPDIQAVPTVLVNGITIHLNDQTPTGGQILAAAGLRPLADYALVRWPSQGPTNEIGLEDVLELPRHGAIWEFFAAKDDGVSYFTLDEERYAWAGPLDEQILRNVGRVAANQQVWFERTGQPDRQLDAGEVIKLDREGVERFYTRKATWKLDVQGEQTEWEQPNVRVRDALIKTGYDLTKEWRILFQVKDQPVRPVALDDILDLSQPGIERLSVVPKNVGNGEGPAEKPRREFGLLPKDELFLTRAGYRWQTINEGQRWLIVENYTLPPGYNAPTCRMAIDIPLDYPGAQLDMFFCDPVLTAHGAVPPQTQKRQTIMGVVFQRWSRHRQAGSEWSPATDSLASHFALIEYSLAREVGA